MPYWDHSSGTPKSNSSSYSKRTHCILIFNFVPLSNHDLKSCVSQNYKNQSTKGKVTDHINRKGKSLSPLQFLGLSWQHPAAPAQLLPLLQVLLLWPWQPHCGQSFGLKQGRHQDQLISASLLVWPRCHNSPVGLSTPALNCLFHQF